MGQSGTGDEGGEPFDVEKFARQTIWSIEWTDEDAAALEMRVVRLEEIIAARWPRSMVLRWRLARELRASAYGLDAPDLGPRDFRRRRTEAAGLQVAYEAQERNRRHEL